MSDDTPQPKPLAKRLGSEALASLIVDALCDAGYVNRADVPRAIAVAASEINVRKSVGDY